jgi:hypothetical protein
VSETKRKDRGTHTVFDLYSVLISLEQSLDVSLDEFDGLRGGRAPLVMWQARSRCGRTHPLVGTLAEPALADVFQRRGETVGVDKVVDIESASFGHL